MSSLSKILTPTICGFLFLFSGCGTTSPEPKPEPVVQDSEPDLDDDEFSQESIQKLKADLGMGFDRSALGNPVGESTGPKSEFQILAHGPVSFTSQSKYFPFQTLTVQQTSPSECELSKQTDTQEKQVLAKYRWKEGTITMHLPATDSRLTIFTKPGKIVIQKSDKSTIATVRTTSKSVNVYQNDGNKEQLLCKMESFPSQWQLRDPTGAIMGTASVVHRVGTIQGLNQEILLKGQNVQDPLGLAFMRLRQLPIEARVALCIYFHQE